MPALHVDFFALKNAYDADGFVVIPGFLSPDEVRELSERTDAAMSDFRYHPKFVGVRKDVDKADPWFAQYFRHGAHVPLIAGLMNDRPTPSSAAFFDKPAGSSVEISQHVDGFGKLDGTTLWIALDTADRGNGCLCYLKGSHRQSWSKDALAAVSEDSEGAVAVEAEPGDAIIHSARTVHWSRKSTCTARRRRAVSFFYWASSCLENMKSWPGQALSEETLAADFGQLNLEAGVAALRTLDRDWAAWPQVVQKFRDAPAKFLVGLKLKDPEAFNILLTASRL